jgi:DNA-binding transcriptional MerR regulator
MKFDITLALKIAEEFDVPTATVRVWEHRGAIPDKYFKQGFSKIKELTEEQKSDAEKIMNFLSLKEIKASAYNKLFTYSAKFTEIKAGSSTITPEEIIAIKGKISELKALLSGLLRDERKFGDKYQERQIAILKRDEIVISVLLKEVGGFSDYEYNQVKGVIDKRRGLLTDLKLIQKLTDTFQKLYVQIKV